MFMEKCQMERKRYSLFEELLKLSSSKNWQEAQLEWYLESISEGGYGDFETCLCGHFPIKKLCYIRNKKTNKQAMVGSCCVKKFDNDYSKVFDGIHKIKIDIYSSTNYETIYYAYENKLINDWEYNFYVDILFKRSLSEKQQEYKTKINKKLILKLDKPHGK